MKVIANHVLDYRIILTPNVGASDRSWVWTAFDFAEGTLVEKTFAIKFGEASFATEFKEKFVSGQKEMEVIIKGADKPDGAAEANDAAAAVESISVKEP